MFGGQNLLPADNQTQLNDMWILTTPSFTWIEVDQSSQSVPYARAGHTCNIWQGQMVVVGGYIGDEISCDSPGIYVYDMSSLTWVEQFTALTASNVTSTTTTTQTATTTTSTTSTETATETAYILASNSTTNPYNQQPAQLANSTDAGGLEGCYGYEVPAVIISIIGGNSAGGATVTAPQVTATAGPLATGKALTYTVTGPGGATATETSYPGSNGTSGGTSSGSAGPNVAAIVAGTIAGLLFLLVCYLAFCAWLYRKRLVLYKRHVDMAQQQGLSDKRRGASAQLPMTAGVHDPARQEGVRASISRVFNGGAAPKNDGYLSADNHSYSGGESPDTRRSNSEEETEDLLGDLEPTFLGVVLAPRRSLRVINQD